MSKRLDPSLVRRACFLGRFFRRHLGAPMDSEKPSTRHFPSGICHRRGGAVTSGWISLPRSKPASSEIIGVSVTTGDQNIDRDAGAVDHDRVECSPPWIGRMVGELAFSIVPRLVVTLTIRPQPSHIDHR
jgi:hypothetical protein